MYDDVETVKALLITVSVYKVGFSIKILTTQDTVYLSDYHLFNSNICYTMKKMKKCESKKIKLIFLVVVQKH